MLKNKIKSPPFLGGKIRKNEALEDRLAKKKMSSTKEDTCALWPKIKTLRSLSFLQL